MSQGKLATHPSRHSRLDDLSADRARRKRELDRIAQRTHRERTKTRISFLEEKIRSLEARDHGGHNSCLMATQESVLKDNAGLTAAMIKMRRIADTILYSLEGGDRELLRFPVFSKRLEFLYTDSSQDIFEDVDFDDTTVSSDQVSDDVIRLLASRSFPSITTLELHEQTADAPSANFDVSVNFNIQKIKDDVEASTFEESFIENQFVANNQHICNVIPSYDIDFTVPDPTNFDTTTVFGQNSSFHWNIPPLFLSREPNILNFDEMWAFCEATFIRGIELTCRDKAFYQKPLDTAVPIQAILWGWQTIDAKTRNHPAWTALRQVGKKVFGSWKSRPQQIALMYVCSLVMQYHIDPTAENLGKLPNWFRPRPSQERIQHPFVIDFLIWPGLRDFLVFNHVAYTQTGEFSQRFTEDFHFNWPFHETLIFEFDAKSGQCAFSKLFKEYSFNLRNWTMNRRFFERYGELEFDIPVYLGPEKTVEVEL